MARRFKAIPVDVLFWSTLHPTLGTDACWEWPKARNKWGYGTFRLPLSDGGQETLAHRVAWTLTYGPIPAGQLVCHTCDNPACCRPSHLWLGTNKENLLDCITKGRMPYKTRKPSGPRPTLRKQPGEWTKAPYESCIECHTTNSPYEANGRCSACYHRLLRRTNVHRQEYLKTYRRKYWEKNKK